MINVLETQLVSGADERQLRRQISVVRLHAAAVQYMQRMGTQCFFVRWQGAARPTAVEPMIVAADRINVVREIVSVRGSEIVFRPYADLYPDWPNEWDPLGLWVDLPQPPITDEHRALLYINESYGLPVDLVPDVQFNSRFTKSQTLLASKSNGGFLLKIAGRRNTPTASIVTETIVQVAVISKNSTTTEVAITWQDKVPGVNEPTNVAIELRRFFRLLQSARQRSLAVVATVPLQRAYGPVILRFASIDSRQQLHVDVDQRVTIL